MFCVLQFDCKASLARWTLTGRSITASLLHRLIFTSLPLLQLLQLLLFLLRQLRTLLMLVLPPTPITFRAATSTRVLASLLLEYSLNSTSGCKFPLPVSIFAELNYWFVAICANLDFAICTLISFNFQLHYNTNNNNEINYCTTMLTKTNNQKRKCKTIGDIGA